MERVQKILAQAGIASRRKAEDLIAQGKVKVNNKVIKLGDKADKRKDTITVNGKTIKLEHKVYYLVNKPRFVLSTTKDERGRKTVVDLVKAKEKVFLVGRLDFDAEGMIILTNDGDLKQKITHPSNEVKKTYEVLLDKALTNKDKKLIKNGVTVEGKKVNVHKVTSAAKRATLTIHEGRKHIVKRLFESLEYKVLRLKRIQIGKVHLGPLKPGKFRKLGFKEIMLLTK